MFDYIRCPFDGWDQVKESRFHPKFGHNTNTKTNSNANTEKKENTNANANTNTETKANTNTNTVYSCQGLGG